MGGGGGKAPTAEITQEEVALAQAAKETWAQFQETGRPAQNEYIARATGYRMNESSGEYEIDPDGPLNADGTTKTDVSAARTAAEVAGVQSQQGGDPNQRNTMAGRYEGINQSIQAETGQAYGQQSRLLTGLDNSVSLLKGEETEALTSQSQLASQAQQTAMQGAMQKQQGRENNANLAGIAVGGATTYLATRGGNEPTSQRGGNGAPPPMLQGRPS